MPIVLRAYISCHYTLTRYNYDGTTITPIVVPSIAPTIAQCKRPVRRKSYQMQLRSNIKNEIWKAFHELLLCENTQTSQSAVAIYIVFCAESCQRLLRGREVPTKLFAWWGDRDEASGLRKNEARKVCQARHGTPRVQRWCPWFGWWTLFWKKKLWNINSRAELWIDETLPRAQVILWS